jgi:hypothetical protein
LDQATVRDIQPEQNVKPCRDSGGFVKLVVTHELLALRAISLVIFLLLPISALPTEDTQKRREVAGPTFEQQVLPILQANCVKCHSGSSPQAGLDVRTRAGLLKGGVSGPAIAIGAPDKSLLYLRVLNGQMPLGAEPLSKPELERIRIWIEQDAPARDLERTSTPPPGSDPQDRAHWSFQPPKRPSIPKLKDVRRVRTPIDAFVLAELEKSNLAFSPDADRVTLIRRAYFDLIGLPPMPQEVDAFLADSLPNAYERLVDKLLASERYGERWARHWLDAAGYADSEGVLDEDLVRTDAWRYRDYVIRSFNSDKPYNRFLMEQLAGDELVDYRQDRFSPEVVECLEATGFLRTAVDATREDFQQPDFAEYQWRTFFDTEQIVATSLLGLTMQCARCHDHKYEPISQRDYYRFQAFFAGAIRPDGPLLPSAKRAIVQASPAERKAAEEANTPLEPVLKAIKGLQEARLAQYRAKHPKGEEASEAEVRQMFPEYAAQADRLVKELEEEKAKLISLPTIRALYDLDSKPLATRVLRRGDFHEPAEEVEAGVPSVLDDLSHPLRVAPPLPDARTTGRRRALAEWLTRPDHPLTARVMVNRIWAAYFGSGLVPTLDNFGKSGASPRSQPLLDWLATEFIHQGWSLKATHRLILTSTAYRQGSRARPEAMRVDPENKMLWRMNPRRLEAETIRDAVLAAAGTLDLKMYGEPVLTETKPTGEIVAINETLGGRRSIYQLVRRSRPQTFLNAFDAPVMETNCTRRTTSTTATQALALMNSEFITAQAEHFSRRVLGEGPLRTGLANPIDPEVVTYAFRMAMARKPTNRELSRMRVFLTEQQALYPDATPETMALRIHADLCQALLSANEFVYLD